LTASTKTEYDVAVVGSGPGGYVAAIRAAQRGAKVAIVERELLGGTCLNWGCIPTKTLIASATLLSKMRNAEQFGIRCTGAEPDIESIYARKDGIVDQLRNGVAGLMKSNGIEVVNGTASVESPAKLVVKQKGKSRTLTARSIIVSTGSEPAEIPSIPRDGKTVITSRDALSMPDVPESIAIVGAGAVGVEFACIYSAFGAEVHLIEMLPRVLPLEDKDISNQLKAMLKRQGINMHLSTKVGAVRRLKSTAKLDLESAKGKKTITTTRVLTAVGRKLNSEVLGKVQPKTENGAIVVNERMETSVAGVYAIGDVVGGKLLAHVASAEGIAAAENATGGDNRMDYRVVPSCTFSTPEVASVGMTESEAAGAGITARVGRFPFAANGRALSMGEPEGFVKIVVDADTAEVLGVHILGGEASQLISEAALAMQIECTAEEIAHTIHVHPTLSEALRESAEAVLEGAIHLPPARSRKA